MSTNNAAKKFKFKKNVDIGSLAAENDHLLIKCFFEKDDLNILRDFSIPKTILIGRTGSGKSALIKLIEDKEQKVYRISPEAMSLKYLSNSTILNYFRNLGVNLDLFYKVLWKHVFIVELLKLHLGSDTSKNTNFFYVLHEKYLMNPKKKKAIDYLRTWKDQFWENTEYRIKEIENVLENKFLDQLSIEDQDFYKGFKFGFKQEGLESESKKIEVLHKAQSVINNIQVQEIYDIVEIMKNDLFKEKHKYYIIIDDLDLDWVDSSIVYDLIKGMVLSINELSSIPGVKIVIALRENINEMIFKKSQQGIQREKYSHLYVKIYWEKQELKQMLNLRLSQLMQNYYVNSQSPTIDDVFAINSKWNGFDYLVERSFLRPRDIISFFNKCIEKADGRTQLSKEIVKQAEIEYSIERLHAVEDEWYDNYGNLSYLYTFLKGRDVPFILNDLKEEDFIDFICLSEGSLKNNSIVTIHKKYHAGDLSFFFKEILFVLYRVGILGVKLSSESPITYSFFQNAHQNLEASDFDEKTKFYIHKMFYSVFKIKA